jgi:hypothetical protein
MPGAPSLHTAIFRCRSCWLLYSYTLENARKRAIEEKDTKLLEMLMATAMHALGSDGRFLAKEKYLASITAPDFQPG